MRIAAQCQRIFRVLFRSGAFVTFGKTIFALTEAVAGFTVPVVASVIPVIAFAEASALRSVTFLKQIAGLCRTESLGAESGADNLADRKVPE